MTGVRETVVAWLALPGMRALAVLVVGLVVVNLLARLVARRVHRTARAHWALVARRFVGVTGSLFVVVAAARVWGLDLTAVLATAGVATIAIGFAAQTSLSNLIAGVFLLVDRPFEVGDTVEMEGRLGVVQEITLMSTLVRTFDNLLVRWPNEVVLKSQILNHTRYPVRRIDVKVRLAYGSDVARARAVLLGVLREEPTFLLDPEPDMVARGMLDYAIDVEARVWVRQPDFLKGRTRAVQVVHDTLREAGFAFAPPPWTVGAAGSARS